MKHLSYIKIVNYITILSMFFLQQELFASNKIIKGNIFDAETNVSLQFANISILGKSMGTVSNADGNFLFNISNISERDTICFSYLGYETLKFNVSQMEDSISISLHPFTCELDEVVVSNKRLTAKKIIELTYKNFKKNHYSSLKTQKLFFHRFITTSQSSKNPASLIKSNVTGLNKDNFKKICKILTCKIVEYQDALFNSYIKNNNHAVLSPIIGISIDEDPKNRDFQTLEAKVQLRNLFTLKDLFKNKNMYTELRTGILFKKKWDYKNAIDTLADINALSKKNYYVNRSEVSNEVNNILYDYSNVESKNLEFINNSNKYNYKIVGYTNDIFDPAYIISFTPKKKGLFEGKIYISTSSYAILQLDFNYLKDKSSENFHLFGFGHSINFKKGHIIFEKGAKNYFVKYINVEEDETTSINRDCSWIKKKKRFFIDKKLKEIKFRLNFKVNKISKFELLMYERKEFNNDSLLKFPQPRCITYKKEDSYSPKFWKNNNIIIPTEELKNYRRK